MPALGRRDLGRRRPGTTEERIYHDELCGEVLSVGRTSIGYFMTVLGEEGTDVVGFGYPIPASSSTTTA